MKKILIIFLSLLSLATLKNTKTIDNSNKTNFSECYVIINRDNLEVLEGKNIHKVRSVASISKVMTCIIALESNRIFDVIVAPNEATKQIGSSIYIQENEKLSLLDLCYGLMLRSGNDAAYTIATYIGGSIDGFVKKMNSKASEIGMKNTKFTNASGLDIDEIGNLSTAYDMAVLMSYALENVWFSKISKTQSYSCKHINTWINKNKLLKMYEYTDGGKTGYTYKAKRTFVSGATKNGLKIAMCTLNCGNDFEFHKNMYEKYFSRLAFIEFLKPGINQIYDYKIESKKRIGIVVPIEKFKNGIKLYKFSSSGQLLYMEYITDDGERIKVNLYE